MKFLSQNIVIFSGLCLLLSLHPAQAKSKDAYAKAMAEIHKTVYQKSFAEKKLRQALSEIKRWLDKKPDPELRLYQSMAHYRLREYFQAFLSARQGLDLQKQVLAQLNKNDQLYGYHKFIWDELETLRDRAQARLELDVYNQKLRHEAKNGQSTPQKPGQKRK